MDGRSFPTHPISDAPGEPPQRWGIIELWPRRVGDSFLATLQTPLGAVPEHAAGYEELARTVDPYLPGFEDVELVVHAAAVTVVATTRTWTEDGLSFHMDAEEGWLYHATVEIANGPAAERALADYDYERRGRAVRASAAQLLCWTQRPDQDSTESTVSDSRLVRPQVPGVGQRDAFGTHAPEYRDELAQLLALPAVPLSAPDRFTVALEETDHARVDNAAGVIYSIVHRWGSEVLVWAHPLTGQRIELVAETDTLFGTGDPAYRHAGVNDEAQAVLRSAGWGVWDLARLRRNMVVDSADDARAAVSHPPRWWDEHGWGSTADWTAYARLAKLPATEVLHLAEADVWLRNTILLVMRGRRTAEEILAQDPPKAFRDYPLSFRDESAKVYRESTQRQRR